MVGNRTGGYALLTTEDFGNKGYYEAAILKRTLDDSSRWPESKARLLEQHGLITYRWNNHNNQFANGAGFHLNRI